MKNNSLFFLGFGIVLLFTFYLFSREVKKERFRTFDFSVTVKVQDRVNHRFGTNLDSAFEDIGFLASPIFSSVVIVGITFFASTKMKRSRKVFVLIIPFAFGLLVLGEIYGKSVVHHPAPPFFMIKNPTTIFPKYYINETFSYPSGHAARAVFIGVLVSSVIYHVSRKRSLYSSSLSARSLEVNSVRNSRLFASNNKITRVVLLSLFYVALVSISRIYLGHHWASDVIGGWLLGGGLGIFSMILL